LLVHNFGTFGVTISYDLFDGGRRNAEIRDSRILLSQAELNLTKANEEVAVQVEAAYDKVEQLQSMVGVADETLKLRMEVARLSDRQFEPKQRKLSRMCNGYAQAATLPDTNFPMKSAI
jgi:outer membrane protein TolC